jgi:hypothetical protein
MGNISYPDHNAAGIYIYDANNSLFRYGSSGASLIFVIFYL